MAEQATATPEERKAAKERIETMVWDELLRIVKAIRTQNALGTNPELIINIDRYGGPALVIDEEELAPLVLARVTELVGQNMDVKLYSGRLRIFSPSWPPDEIPF